MPVAELSAGTIAYEDTGGSRPAGEAHLAWARCAVPLRSFLPSCRLAVSTHPVRFRLAMFQESDSNGLPAMFSPLRVLARPYVSVARCTRGMTTRGGSA